MIKLVYIILALGVLCSCNSRTSKNRTQQRDSEEIEQASLIKQTENKGFQKGIIQHSLNTKWSEFSDKVFYTYIKTLKSGMQVYRAEIPNMMLEVYVLNDIITIQSSSIMLGNKTQQVYAEMNDWLQSCNPISTSNSYSFMNGKSTQTHEYLFSDFKATLIMREQGIQYMLELCEEENKTASQPPVLSKNFSNEYFSIKYPSSWQIIQEEKQVTNNTAISLQIMEIQKNDYDFRPNINIIVSNKKWKESTAYLAEQTSQNNKRLIPSYSQLSISNNIVLAKCRGSLLQYSCSIQDYQLEVNQYIVKKTDNTTFIITVTLDGLKYAEQMTVAQSILKSLIIN